MDIRQLHYFLVLCEEMNYTRAAQRLFLSRQALRQSITTLEAELCGPLFVSAHHKLSLTERGLSLQRHAAPVVEQFQQMQAALHAEIQSAQPVRIGISVSLVPDYLPGLETQLDKFRQQYPHIEMRFRLLDNDAVADGVEQGELDAGLVMDLGCAAQVLARTTLRADPACLLVPRGHPFWEKERVPLAALRGQRVLLPSLRQDLFAPLWDACAKAGFAPDAEIGPSFYQAYYLVQEQLCTCLTRYEPGARRELDRVRDVLIEDMPPLCVSMVQRRDHNSAYLDLLRSYLMEVLGGTASLPPRRGRPAKPFYSRPVLSSTAVEKPAPHPAPGTQLPFAGGNNFRELGGYPADEGKHVRWGQIYRGIPTGLLTSDADRKLLDSLGLRLILDLRSEQEAEKMPDYVPDGARMVRICGLCLDDGKEVDFSPEDAFRQQGLQGAVPCSGSGRDAGALPLLRRQGPHRRGGYADPAGAGRFGRDDPSGFRPDERMPPPGAGKDLGRTCRRDRRPPGTEEVLSGHRRGAPRIGGPGALRHPGKMRQRRGLPRSRIRPDPGPPDAAAADVSGVNFQNCARFP